MQSDATSFYSSWHWNIAASINVPLTFPHQACYDRTKQAVNIL